MNFRVRGRSRLGPRGEEARQLEGARHARRVVGRRLEVTVGVGHDDDLLVGHARQRGHGVLGRDVPRLVRLEPERERDPLARGQPISECEALVHAQGEVRDLAQAPLGLKLPVAGHPHHVHHHRRAQGDRPPVGVEEPGAAAGRVAAATRDEDAVDDDRLPLDVATDEVGPRADADPHRLGRDATGSRGLRAGHREGRGQGGRRAVAGPVAGGPVGRPPVGGQHVGKVLDRQPEGLELARHVGHALAVGRGAGQPSPPLVPGVAIAEGDLRQLDDVPLHARAVDARILLLLRCQRPHRILVVVEDQAVAVPGQPRAVGRVHAGARVHLRGRRGGSRENRDRGQPGQHHAVPALACRTSGSGGHAVLLRGATGRRAAARYPVRGRRWCGKRSSLAVDS